MIEPSITSDFRIDDESLYYSILPTATQYSRNAIFSGLLPLEMERLHKKIGGKTIWMTEVKICLKSSFFWLN